MIVALARKTLINEWRRFLPAVVAVAFSALLLLVQTALVLGIFGSAAIYIEASKGDLWVGYPGTRTVELGRLLPADTEIWVRLDEAVDRVEPYRWLYGDWRVRSDQGAFSMYVSGIDTSADGLMFTRVLPASLRARLDQPDSIVVDVADMDKLGVALGDRPRINGHAVEVVGTLTGLRTLGGVNILTSLETAGRIQPGGLADERVAYYVVRLRDGANAADAQRRLNALGREHGFQVWSRDEFAKVVTRYWLFDTGAGLAVLFLSVVVSLTGAVITSQTLMGAVAGSASEYAALQALGIGMGALRRVVIEQAAWIGASGLLLGVAGAAAALWMASRNDVPIAVEALPSLACALLVLGISMISGWAAVRALRQADPASLLR
jgi:putative ABC transport system permease protein